MIEALVGVLFAAFFVTVYFIITFMRRRGEVEGSNRSELYPPALRGANPIETKPKLFRTTDEMSRYHLPAAVVATPPKLMKQGTDEPGPPGERA